MWAPTSWASPTPVTVATKAGGEIETSTTDKDPCWEYTDDATYRYLPSAENVKPRGSLPTETYSTGGLASSRLATETRATLSSVNCETASQTPVGSTAISAMLPLIATVFSTVGAGL